MLPYSAEVLTAVLAQMNRALWPAPLLVPAGLLLLLALATSGQRGSAAGRAVLLALAAAWLWLALGYQMQTMAALDFLAPVHAAVYAAGALLLGFAASLRQPPALRFQGGAGAWTGLGLVFLGLAGLPLLAWIAGRELAALPVAGLAPGPTAVTTLGVLLLARWTRGRLLALAAVPLLWTLFAGYVGLALGLAANLVQPLAGGVALAGLLWFSPSSPPGPPGSGG